LLICRLALEGSITVIEGGYLMAAICLGRGRFYGWIALAGAMLVYFCGCGDLFYSFGVFMPSICADLGWTRSMVAGAYSLLVILIGLAGPLVGFSVTRFGARKNIVLGNLVAVLGLLGLFWTAQPWHIFVFYGLLVGVGNAFGMFISATTIANNWFIRRRSLAMSLVIASGGIGGLVIPPLIALMISSVGWRFAWLFLALIHLILAVIIPGLIIRNRPEDMGQVPDGLVGGAVPKAGSGAVPQSRVYQTPVDWETGDAMRTLALWMIIFLGAAHMFAVNAIMAHLVLYLRDVGFSLTAAAFALGLIPGLSIIGRLGMGYLATRFEVRYLAAICLGGLMIAMLILMSITALPLIYLFCLLFGISYGALIVALPTFFGAYFGRARYAQILGWTMPITTLVGAVGGPLAGVIHDATGSYMMAFIIAVAFLVIGVVCALLARPPKPRFGLGG